MNILDKRPLSIVLTGILSAFVLFCRFGTTVKIIFLIVNAVLLFLSFLPKLGVKRLFRTLLCATLLFALLSDFYFNGFYFAEKRFEGEIEATGIITEISYAEESVAHFTLRTDNMNEKAFSHYSLRVTIENVNGSDLNVGDKIRLKGTLQPLDDAYDYGIGISAIAVSDQPYEKISEDNRTLRLMFSDIRRKASALIMSTSESEEVGGLLSALLLGDRSALSPQLALDFKRIGVSHILALSGMHLAIISLFLSAILSVFGVGKKGTKIVLLIFVPIYIILTGASPSILRAGIMLIFYSILFLLWESNDSLTTLLLSVFLILVFEPYAAFSSSLWLSALATFGVISFPVVLEKKPKTKLFCYIFSSVIFSFSALFPTLPITAYLYGSFSILSPLSTLLLAFLTQAFIFLGIFLFLFGKIIPASFLLDKLYQCIGKTAESLSDISFCTIDVSFVFTKILIGIFLICAVLFLIRKVRRKGLCFMSLVLFLFVIGGCGALLQIRATENESMYYLPKVKDEYIVAFSGGKTILFDYSTNTPSKTYDLQEDLSSLHISTLDTLVITQYAASLPSSLSAYLSRIPVREIYLPVAQNAEETDILSAVRDELQPFRTSVSFYEADEHIGFENIAWHPIYISRYGYDSGCVMVVTRDADSFYTYFGKGTYFDLKKETAADLTANSLAVIFGCHGNKAKNASVINLHNDHLTVAVFADEDVKINRESDLSSTEIYAASYLPTIIPLYVE